MSTLAYFNWEDAWMPEDDTDLSDIAESCILEAGGIIVREDDYKICIAADYAADDNTARRIICIPKKYIVGDIVRFAVGKEEDQEEE